MNQTRADIANVWETFGERLFRFIQQRVKNKADAEDILHDVFLKIHDKIHSLNDQTRLQSWLYQVTRNGIVDHFRKKQTSGEAEIPELVDIDENPDETHQLMAGCLHPFIDQLPDKYREALTLTELGGLSQKAMAEQLGISHSGAKSRVQRARKQLRKDLEDCCKFEVDQYGTISEFKRHSIPPACEEPGKSCKK